MCVLLTAQINQPKLPLRTLDPRILPRGPDFTPAFADFGRQAPGGRNMSGSVSSPQLAHLKTVLMKYLIRFLGLFQCAGGSRFIRMNAGVMFTWLTKCREIGNSCGCLSWVGVVWEGFDLLLSPCVREWKCLHTRTWQLGMQSRVCRTTNPVSVHWPGGLCCKAY